MGIKGDWNGERNLFSYLRFFENKKKESHQISRSPNCTKTYKLNYPFGGTWCFSVLVAKKIFYGNKRLFVWGNVRRLVLLDFGTELQNR